MYRVDIYTAVRTSSSRKTIGKYGYVCTCIKKSGGMGKIQDIDQMKGTRHETEVKAMTQALERLNQSCEVHIHCEDDFVINMIEHFLQLWAGNDFKNAKGKPVTNAEGWRALWKKMQGHVVKMERGPHDYSDEIREKMEEKQNV